MFCVLGSFQCGVEIVTQLVNCLHHTHCAGFFSFFLLKNYIRVQLIYYVVLISAIHQSELVIHIHVFSFFKIPLHIGHCEGF